MEPTARTAADPLYACIDCGTNSVKLVVAAISRSSAQPIFEISETTRIGEGMQANGMRLQKPAMDRTCEVIGTFVKAAQDHGAREIILIGTAALRDAENRDDFLKQVKEHCGLDLKVISGEEEARLSYLAVRRDPHWIKVPRLLVIDIGGGSTELIEGESHGDGIQARRSVNLGAVKLTEAWLRSDPVTTEELAAAGAAASEAFGRTSAQVSSGEPFHIVGVGGTLTNLGAMKLATDIDPERLHGLTINETALERILSVLAERSVEQRRQLPGLDPRRADIILAGTLLLLQALRHIGSDRIDISTRGLRWGALYDRFMPAESSGLKDLPHER
jgi:exopolyphosphatase/guanosine-5'-triphosphate,3'-diphosphate pyrophosphatase